MMGTNKKKKAPISLLDQHIALIKNQGKKKTPKCNCDHKESKEPKKEQIKEIKNKTKKKSYVSN
jgi:hypothetical protein